MSYIIEPMPLISFLEDNKLKLPRFQRKATWNKKQNFELAISVFQDYPVGVVIVNQEQNVSWLLDGRQRRTALSAMRANPVELYEWAKNYIGFNKTADNLEVKKLYWEKVTKYLETEDDDNKDENSEYGDLEDDYQEEERSFDAQKQREGLQTLLDLILMVHQNKPTGSRWQQLFNFNEFIPKIKYAPANENRSINPEILRSTILEILKFMDSNNGITKDLFLEYYLQYFYINDEDGFKKDVDKKWDDIASSLKVIDKSEKIFTDARIGIIRLKNASPLDAQNIFSRINRGGTQLKAEELLSAKPYWNKSVGNVNIQTKQKIEIMYNNLLIQVPETFVRWDIAATLISRLKDDNLIFKSYEKEKSKNEVSMDEITLGFKLLSSIYCGGMSNKHVNDIEKSNEINWNGGIDELICDLNTIFNILLSDSFFKYFQSWKCPMTTLLGNAIGLEFITILWLDWKEKGSPKFTSANTHALQRDAKILFDKLVFEYATKTWRGSGDSKMAKDIKNWKSRIVQVDDNAWRNFIKEACNGYYNGQDTTVKTLRPIIYYYYCINQCVPINQINVTFDVDHIIPQESFKNNGLIDFRLKDSLSNLALLPTKDNISKKAKRLNEITDNWLKNSITTYTGITEDRFECFSDIANFNKLKNFREKNLINTFITKRKSNLVN